MNLSAKINTAMTDKVIQALAAQSGRPHGVPHAFNRLRIVVVGNNTIRDVVQQVIDPDYATVHLARTEDEAIQLICRGTIPDLLVSTEDLQDLHLQLIAEGIDEVVPQCLLTKATLPSAASVRKAIKDYLPDQALFEPA
jgi:hypothetical protein